MRANGSPPGGSILTTEAPMAQSRDAATGPGRFTASVSTDIPSSGILPEFRSASAALMRTYFGTLSGTLRSHRKYSRVSQASYRANNLLHGGEFVHNLVSLSGPLQVSGVEVGAQDQHPHLGIGLAQIGDKIFPIPVGEPQIQDRHVEL